MTESGFTWGAHLLMWVFPAVLVLVAVALYIAGGRRPGNRR
jgi:cytochrome c-type biogenesis protein CcmH/NrfF